MTPQEKFNAWIDRRSTFTLFMIFVAITLLRFLPTLICLGISINYSRQGNFDLFGVWLMLAALTTPWGKK